MTNIGLVSSNQLYCKVIEFCKIVTRISDLPRFVTQPADHLQDTLEIPSFLFLWISIVVPQITLPIIVRSVSEVDEDSLGMSDMEITIWLWGETSPHLSASGSQVSFTEVRENLRISARFMKRSKEALFEYCLPR